MSRHRWEYTSECRCCNPSTETSIFDNETGDIVATAINEHISDVIVAALNQVFE